MTFGNKASSSGSADSNRHNAYTFLSGAYDTRKKNDEYIKKSPPLSEQLTDFALDYAAKSAPSIFGAGSGFIGLKPGEFLGSIGTIAGGALRARGGEQETGPRTNAQKRKEIQHYSNLGPQFAHHWMTGGGRPVEVDMSKLDFSDDLEDIKRKEIQEGIKNSFSTGTSQHIGFVDKAVINAPSYKPNGFPFGRAFAKMEDVQISVDKNRRLVKITSQLSPSKPDGEFDMFDFNPEYLEHRVFQKQRGRPTRNPIAESITRSFHYHAPPGTTGYKIYGKPGTKSKYEKYYTFDELKKRHPEIFDFLK